MDRLSPNQVFHYLDREDESHRDDLRERLHVSYAASVSPHDRSKTFIQLDRRLGGIDPNSSPMSPRPRTFGEAAKRAEEEFSRRAASDMDATNAMFDEMESRLGRK